MTEEKTPLETPVEEPVEAPAEGMAKPDIAAELQDLGHQLTAATKAVLESPEAQRFKSQMQQGLESLSKSVDQLAKQARETQVGQKVESGVGEAAATLKERRVLETLAESVASALQTVNQSLAKEVEKAHKRTEEAQAKKAEPPQIEAGEE
jgi:hypothetical protein